jgi:colanic acid biosynthesis protein WcaH
LAHIIRHAPLVSIDLIVHNSLGEVLLGKRSNAPARQMWFVPGGRIHKGERIPQALERVILEELGPQEPPQEVNFHGIFDHMYEENVFGYPEFGTHYVVLAHRIIMDLSLGSLPDGQHQEYRWWSIDQMLASPLVHSYTQANFC